MHIFHLYTSYLVGFTTLNCHSVIPQRFDASSSLSLCPDHLSLNSVAVPILYKRKSVFPPYIKNKLTHNVSSFIMIKTTQSQWHK